MYTSVRGCVTKFEMSLFVIWKENGNVSSFLITYFFLPANTTLQPFPLKSSYKETPTLSKDLEPPTLYIELETPTLYNDLETPTLCKNFEKPILYKELETPAFNKDLVKPKLYKDFLWFVGQESTACANILFLLPVPNKNDWVLDEIDDCPVWYT